MSAEEGEEIDEAGEGVGYRRPPSHTRFEKGRSGNPGGRRRGKSLAAMVAAVLDRPAVIVEDGRRRPATQRELIAAQLVERSAKADLRALRLLIDLVHRVERPRAEAPPAADFDEADEKVMAILRARLRQAEAEPTVAQSCPLRPLAGGEGGDPSPERWGG